MTQVRNRIIDFRRVRAGDLFANPRNWRTHPQNQINALYGILEEIGYADALIARELPDKTLELIDGHARQALDPEQIVPVLVVDLNQAEALKLMLVLDPLAGMTEANQVEMRLLLAEIRTDSQAVQAMLADLAKQYGREVDIQPPESFGEVNEDIETKFICQKCGYQWSGGE